MVLIRRLLSSRSAIALLLIIATGAFLRFFAIGFKTVWLDEAFSIWVANHGIFEGAGWLIKIDQHPPLYYSLLSVWQWIFDDIFLIDLNGGVGYGGTSNESNGAYAMSVTHSEGLGLALRGSLSIGVLLK